jgi:hypothetical protein
MPSILTGAWSLVSDSQVGMALFTDTHFSIVLTGKNKAPLETGQTTPGKTSESFHSLLAAAGTYKVSVADSILTLHHVANPDPNLTGINTKWELSINGNRAKTRNIKQDGSLGPTETWEKVS